VKGNWSLLRRGKGRAPVPFPRSVAVRPVARPDAGAAARVARDQDRDSKVPEQSDTEVRHRLRDDPLECRDRLPLVVRVGAPEGPEGRHVRERRATAAGRARRGS